MPYHDIQTSIHGRRAGLGPRNSLVLNSSDGQAVVTPGVTNATTAAVMSNSGVSIISTALVGYTLEDPVPGVRKTIIAPNPSTATTRFVQTSTANGVTFATTLSANRWGSTASQTLELVGISTTQYAVISNAAASSLSTSVGAFSTI